MRRFTLITIICLAVLLAGAAVVQLVIAGAEDPADPWRGVGVERVQSAIQRELERPGRPAPLASG